MKKIAWFLFILLFILCSCSESPPSRMLNAKISSIPKYIYSEDVKVKVLDVTLRDVYKSLVKFDKEWAKLSENRWALKTKTTFKENDTEMKISYCFTYHEETNSAFLYEVYVNGEEQKVLELGTWADELENQAKLHAIYSR